MGKKLGVSFSWKRATGISAAKGKLSRSLGIPLTRQGRQRKIGRMAGCIFPIIILFIGLLSANCSLILPMPTSTPIPTNTPIPTLAPTFTATINPCSDNGWKTIGIYLNQFNRVLMEAEEGDSTSSFFDQLTNLKNKIDGVQVDACSEFAKQTFLKSLDSQIFAHYALYIEENDQRFDELMERAVRETTEGVDELVKLGISLF